MWIEFMTLLHPSQMPAKTNYLLQGNWQCTIMFEQEADQNAKAHGEGEDLRL